jgi:SAM-dependent methyltransferase
MQLDTCEVLCCPACRSALDPLGVSKDSIDEGALSCSSCQRRYPVHEGIPIFLDDHLRVKPAGTSFATLDEPTRKKILQREWHDRERLDLGYKLADYHSNSFFSYLLYYQMREMEGLLAKNQYSSIANIGAGHGFELEFLSRFCRRVLAVDISCNSLKLALRRGCELGLRVEGVCADAETLPLRDFSFDLVFTHHSLHHLPNPLQGLSEMVRVSRRSVAVLEPAKGLTRTLLTALRIKPEVEESGNFVYEFDCKAVEAVCSKEHLQLRHFRKSLITGPADEPAWFRGLDSRHITPVLCRAISLGNHILGNALGTKCSFLLERNGNEAGLPHSAELCSRAIHGE